MRNIIRLRNNSDNSKLCYKNMTKFWIQAIQSLDQKHSDFWPAFFLILCVHVLQDDHQLRTPYSWLGILFHSNAQNGWCSLSKSSELSNFTKKYFSWSHTSVLSGNLIGLAKLCKKSDGNENRNNKLKCSSHWQILWFCDSKYPGWKTQFKWLKFYKLSMV